MRALIDFLRKYNYLFLFLVLEVVAGVLLFRFNTYQGSVWFTAANRVVGNIDAMRSETEAFVNRQNVNRQLTGENIRLQQEADALREALRLATRDTTYTERTVMERLADYHTIPAIVVSNTKKKGNNYLVINRGERDGVKAEMGVVGGGGVVGIVYLTGENYSLVIPITNRKSSISCRLRGQDYFGYLQWNGESMLSASLDDVPRYAKVKKGEVVETSGYSSVFPPGIFVGRVNSVGNSPDGQSYKLGITLGTNFANIRDVNVIATNYKAETDTLLLHAAHAEGNTNP